MWQNSSELLDYALRELQVAIDNGKGKVEIVLEEYCNKDSENLTKISNRLEIKRLTEMLRERFNNYNIKSVVRLNDYLNFAICFRNTPGILSYPLIWTLTLQKK